MGEDRPDFQPRQDLAVRSGEELIGFVETRNSTLGTGETETVDFTADTGTVVELVDLFFEVDQPPGTGGHIVSIFAGTFFFGSILEAQSSSSAGLEFNFGRWVEADEDAQPPNSADPLAYQRVTGQVVDDNDPLTFQYTNNSDLGQTAQRAYALKGVERQVDP